MELAAGPGFSPHVMAKSTEITDALKRLAAAEERFLASEFLSPVIRGGQVTVRIAGVIVVAAIRPVGVRRVGRLSARLPFRGSARLPGNVGGAATLPRPFSRVRLILTDRCEEEWLASPAADRADSRFQIEGMIRFIWSRTLSDSM